MLGHEHIRRFAWEYFPSLPNDYDTDFTHRTLAVSRRHRYTQSGAFFLLAEIFFSISKAYTSSVTRLARATKNPLVRFDPNW